MRRGRLGKDRFRIPTPTMSRTWNCMPSLEHLSFFPMISYIKNATKFRHDHNRKRKGTMR